MASSASHTMNGGDGKYSYSVHSINQRKAVDLSRKVLVDAIIENLDVETQTSPIARSLFRIADLGCSAGPNTFFAINNIIEALTQKYQLINVSLKIGNNLRQEFRDLFTEDCFLKPPLILFTVSTLSNGYLRYHKRYFDSKSPAFNKGRIMYGESASEVGPAFSDQYAKDMQCLFDARAQELVPGGLLLLLIPGRPDGTVPAQNSFHPLFEPMESSLVDMVNEGIICEEKLDYFNLPILHPWKS